MVIRLSSHVLTLFALLNVFGSRTSGFPALGTYSHLRATRHADALFTSGYSKLLGQLSARKYLESLMGKRVSTQDEQNPVKRHSDAVFTDNYSRIRKQMALKKYINGLLAGKRSQEELNSANLSDNTPLVENYDSVTVDEFLSQLPALNL
ncbi:VIP peptides isoform X2 [Stegostoma tigrinum]|uniref:VIP peptides isoform X2 n=1 Tax=Stegostoma tigrinum TaxID=3053191 RepID=UPI00202B33E1|nr:VIP peptides isoform X2 [Stegostoma tigrinum]